jgi:hypothetical protein
VAYKSDTSLEAFFRRPLLIREFSWVPGNVIPLFEDFNPWADFFTNPRVINRITNYNLMRCKLHVKFMINGNGFYYGRLLANYKPLVDYDEVTRDRGLVVQDNIAASQRPHVYLDPTSNQGGTLVLPFVWYYNALSVTAGQWNRMGRMSVRELTPLKHANGASDAITISVFAWAEEVSLDVPTQFDPADIVPQLGDFIPQSDEYSGIISRPAAIVAKAAGALANIPAISAYARATEMAANAMASIASVFGYSRPIDVERPMKFAAMPVGNLANTNVLDTSTKLTLDVKQETTVDPRVVGLSDTDEMAIRSISMRESFLTAFGWQIDSAAGDHLFSVAVTPVVYDVFNSGPDEFHLTPSAFATLPFGYWRGSMRYRFQVVASAYHKGRLRFVYDPQGSVSDPEYNVAYTHIMDLAKERDFTLDVGWGQPRPYLEVPIVTAGFIPFSTSPQVYNSDFYNGTLAVYVVNELTSPNSTINNDVRVNVFVETCDDFEVFGPTDNNLNTLSYFQPQLGFVPQMAESQPDADRTTDESAPMMMRPEDTMAATLSEDHTPLVFHADPVVSFRQCLKRYNYHTTYTDLSTATFSLFELTNQDFPFYRGYDPDGRFSTSTGENYNFCKFTLLNYLTPAYVCVRGGLRVKYYTRIASDRKELVCVTRLPGDATVGSTSTPITLGSQSAVAFGNMALEHTWLGTMAQSTFHNPVVEVELPYYANYRFRPGRQIRINTPTGPGLDVNKSFHRYQRTSAVEEDLVYAFASTAEDFNLNFFIGVPPLFRYVDPPPATP